MIYVNIYILLYLYLSHGQNSLYGLGSWFLLIGLTIMVIKDSYYQVNDHPVQP